MPKQFWAPDGTLTFLEATLRRTSPLSVPSRTFVVVDRSHGPWVDALPQVHRMGRVIYQDGDRGTAAGVLLGLYAALAQNPHAIVLLTPSDHGISGDNAFRQGVMAAVNAIGRRRAGVVLFGVTPSAASPDYGWIAPAAGSSGAVARLRPVAGFVEKPTADTAARLWAAGYVWNTMILVARASRLVALFERHLPAMSRTFEAARQLRGRAAMIQPTYDDLMPADLSRDLLSHAEGLSLYIWPASLGWSDLGTPERLDAWRDRDLPVTSPTRGRLCEFLRGPAPSDACMPPSDDEVSQWRRFARFSYRRTSARRRLPPASTHGNWLSA